jgi:AhpD family alkylhydroperoxidase
VRLNPATKLDGKTKELIGLAVAAQIPCHYCVYFHTAAARLNGATDQEIREAVGMPAISRHWSTVLNGMQVDTARAPRPLSRRWDWLGLSLASRSSMRCASKGRR